MAKPKYHAGQHVRIQDTPASFNWNDNMTKWCGTIQKILKKAPNYSDKEYYYLEMTGTRYVWCVEWIIPIIPSRAELNKALLNGEITVEDYQEGLKDVESTI